MKSNDGWVQIGVLPIPECQNRIFRITTGIQCRLFGHPEFHCNGQHDHWLPDWRICKCCGMEWRRECSHSEGRLYAPD